MCLGAMHLIRTVAGLGTYLHGIGYDLEQFMAELQAAGEYIMSQQK